MGGSFVIKYPEHLLHFSPPNREVAAVMRIEKEELERTTLFLWLSLPEITHLRPVLYSV